MVVPLPISPTIMGATKPFPMLPGLPRLPGPRWRGRLIGLGYPTGHSLATPKNLSSSHNRLFVFVAAINDPFLRSHAGHETPNHHP